MDYIKQNIRYLRELKGVSQGNFAELLEITRTNLAKYETVGGVKIEVLQRIGNKFHISIDDLINKDLSKKGEYSASNHVREVNEDIVDTYPIVTDKKLMSQQVPLYEFTASAGLTQLFNDSPNILSHIQIPNLPKCDGAIFVTGDSMYPLVKSGDIVIYKRVKNIQSGIIYGEIHILSVVIDDELHTMVKFIQKSSLGPEFITLVSQNDYHSPRDVHFKDVAAVALVKASIRYNTMS